YVYVSSLFFWLFGVSDLSLRLTSLFFFLLFLIGSLKLAKLIFPEYKLIRFYTLLAAGTMPWLFSLSRISFEVISQPAIIIWGIFFIIKAYKDTSAIRQKNLIHAATAGSLIGLSVYSYSSG